MMKISIYKFRCWQNVELCFNPGEITLVKGNSGGGKSTILQAITWCLFGNVKCITPFNEPKAKTQVTIEMENLKIIRSRNPSILQVYLKDQESCHYDIEGQTIINSIFSRYDLWLCSSYVAQSCRNSFLTSPNQDKTQLLRELAFRTEDPKVVIDAIDKFLINFETKYKLESSSFNKDFTNFENSLSKETAEIQFFLENNTYELIGEVEEELKNVINQNNKVSLEIEELRKVEEEIRFQKSVLNMLQKDLKNLLLKKPIKKSLKNIEELELINEQIETILPLLKNKEDLEKEIKALDTFQTEEREVFTLEDLIRSEESEKLYSKGSLLCKKVGIKYDLESVQNYIDKNERILNFQEPVEKLNKLIEKNRKLIIPNKPVFNKIIEKNFIQPDENIKTDLERELSDYSDQLKDLEKQLSKISQGLNVLVCPCCEGNLKIVGKKLIIAESAPSNDNEIKDCNAKISNVNKKIIETNKKIKVFNDEVKNYHANVLAEERRLNKLREEEKNYQNVLTKIEEISSEKEQLSLEIENIKNLRIEGIPLLKNSEKDAYRSNIFSLKNLVFCNLPEVSSKKIKEYFKNLENMSQINSLKVKLQECIEEIKKIEIFKDSNFKDFKDFKEILQNNKKEIKEIESYLSNFEAWENNVNMINDKISKVTILESTDLEDKIFESKKLENSIREKTKIIDLLTEREKYDQIYESLSNDYIKMSKLRVLKQKAIEAEYQTLETTSETINSMMGEICSYLFEEHIEIEINMFKNLKSNNNQKAQINFSINYQGGNYDSINQLSGGEGDRASLALTLSLNKILCSPILMFDESLASLDNNMKEISIKSIKHNINDDTIVIVVMHDGIEGIYDEIIDINDIKN